MKEKHTLAFSSSLPTLFAIQTGPGRFRRLDKCLNFVPIRHLPHIFYCRDHASHTFIPIYLLEGHPPIIESCSFITCPFYDRVYSMFN